MLHLPRQVGKPTSRWWVRKRLWWRESSTGFALQDLPLSARPPQCARSKEARSTPSDSCQELGIPTAAFETVETFEEAAKALSGFASPVVIKTDGLAAGKGVIIAAIACRSRSAHWNSLACPLVIEEFLDGEEVSFIVLCDGRRAVPLEPSQDHKRVFDGDQGPNTGGMGAYSDSRILSEAKTQPDSGHRSSTPSFDATGFTGFLYAGLMMTAEGPKVLEFNVRMGDPGDPTSDDAS